MDSAFPELNVKLSARRWPCVLDPALALSRHGLLIARQVGEVVQLWLVRELWHILDSSEFYVQHPEALIADQSGAQTLKWAIKDWERIRLEDDLAGLKLYWIGDGLSESVLPEEVDAHLLHRYESFACALNRRITAGAPMIWAMRDAAALAAALGSTLVLSSTLSADRLTLPPVCSALQSWDIACTQIDPTDPIAMIERDHLRHLLVRSGLAHLTWAGLRLAAVRLLLPHAPQLLVAPAADDLAPSETVSGEDERPGDPWEGAQAFWYPI